MTSLIMNLQIFKTEKDDNSTVLNDAVQLLNISDIREDGKVEIHFEWPLNGADDVHIVLDIGELVSKAMDMATKQS